MQSKNEDGWLVDVPAFQAATSHLSAEDFGVYMLTMMRKWRDGEIPDDQMPAWFKGRCKGGVA